MGIRPPADRPGALAKEHRCGIMAAIRRKRVTRSAGTRLSTGALRPALAGSKEEDASVGLFSRIWRGIQSWLLLRAGKAQGPRGLPPPAPKTTRPPPPPPPNTP